MNNNTIITIVIVLVLVAGGFLLFKNKGVAPTEDGLSDVDVSVEINEVDSNAGTNENTSNSPGASGTFTTGVTKEFSVDGDNFSFSPASMTVNVGDTVKITMRNTDTMPHDFKIDALGVSTNVLNPGESQTITFIADKTGTFEFYCSVGNHRAMGMIGTLSVR